MADYRNTKEGRIVSQKYADILPLSRPEPIRPRMTTLNRAKIFSPFAALRGYEEEINDQNRVQDLVTKTELSDEDKNTLSDKLLQVKKGMMLTVQYFKADEVYAPLGSYRMITGAIAKIDPVYREIEIHTAGSGFEKDTKARISFDDLVEITGDGIVGIEEYLGIEVFPDD
jgi:hypothetical protein